MVIADSCVSCRCDIACTRGKLRTRQSSWIPSWPSGGQSSRLGFVSPAKLKIFGAAFFRLAAWTKQNGEFSLNVCDTLSGLGDIVGLKWVPVFFQERMDDNYVCDIPDVVSLADKSTSFGKDAQFLANLFKIAL